MLHTVIEICVQSPEIIQSPLLQRRNYVIQEYVFILQTYYSLHKLVEVEVVKLPPSPPPPPPPWTAFETSLSVH